MTNSNDTNILKDDLMKLLFSMDETISLRDFGWWLKTKTGDKYTIFELDFIIETMSTLEHITTTIQNFQNKWTIKTKCFKSQGDYTNY